jgi:hypothetical protein
MLGVDPAPVEEVVWQKPDNLAGQLEWPESGRWLLVWEGEINEQQASDLLSLRGDLAFKAALQQLVDEAALPERPILLRIPVSLPPDPLPDDLAQRYQLERDAGTLKYTGLTWLGSVDPDQEEFAKLRAWGSRSAELAEAVEALIDKITPPVEHQPVTVPLDIELRPQQGELPATLAEQLLLGRQVLVARAQISADDATQLESLFTFTPEKRAIRRLPAATLANSLAGRTLELRTRRGSAKPSDRIPIAISAEGV